MVIIAAFLVSLLGFVAIGVYAVKHKADTTEDYLLASRSVGLKRGRSPNESRHG
ncbi:MAG: hypothetical protein O3A53_20990 [Acidobacteria bacterium]|nr:hypothetical protein [Acidobacteriota bacterium]MDA1237252.1 hypothetical protein [Acidobacteriota bacterium]